MTVSILVRYWLCSTLVISLVAAIACGGTSSPAPSSVPKEQAKALPTAVPQPAAKAKAAPQEGKTKALAVIASEPETLFYMLTADAHTGQFSDTINAYIGHLDKNTLEVSPTSLVVSWKQTAPDAWEYKLRP